MIEIILMLIGVLMILGIIYPRMYGQRATRSRVVKVSGGMFILIMLVYSVFFNGDQKNIVIDTISDSVSDTSDIENPSLVTIVDTVPEFILDNKLKQDAVKAMDRMYGLGLLVKADPGKNTLYVDPTKWISLNPEFRKVICLMGAIYFTVVNDDDKKVRAVVRNVHSKKVYIEFKSGVIYHY